MPETASWKQLFYTTNGSVHDYRKYTLTQEATKVISCPKEKSWMWKICAAVASLNTCILP